MISRTLEIWNFKAFCRYFISESLIDSSGFYKKNYIFQHSVLVVLVDLWNRIEYDKDVSILLDFTIFFEVTSKYKKRKTLHDAYIQDQWLYAFIKSRTLFRVDPHCIVDWTSRNALPEAGAISQVSVTATALEPTTSLRTKRLWVRVPWQLVKL